MTTEEPQLFTGPWTQTHMGIQFRLLEPRAEDVNFADICWSLANQCRFNGHCRPFYSVAEHSIRVADLVQHELGLPDSADEVIAAFMHDAAEAYIGDIIAPLKNLPMFGAIHDVEARIMRAIGERFGFDPLAGWDAVRYADRVMLATEARDLMAPPPAPWLALPPPLASPIWPLSPDKAEWEFSGRMYRYAKARGTMVPLLYVPITGRPGAPISLETV